MSERISILGELPPKPLALITDIDDTLTTEFDIPIVAACDLLRSIDRFRVAVHYVTARPEVTRDGTERFIVDQKLPGWKNLHFCPHWKASRVHKSEVHLKLAKEYRVIASIGDHEEERAAAHEANIPFVLVEIGRPEIAWKKLAEILDDVLGQK